MHKADAMTIIREYATEVPVRVDEAIRAIGVDYAEEPLRGGISGKIERLRDGRFKITVNSSDAPVRRRFTAAHELGHYLFHKHLIDKGHTDILYRKEVPEGISASRVVSPKISPAHEVEANRFAANLLMPMGEIKKYQTLHGHNVGEMARHFSVSRRAMEIRLKPTGGGYRFEAAADE